ncbi:MAG: lysophospholipid acyltransferase family protein [Bacteroidota bacterium]
MIGFFFFRLLVFFYWITPFPVLYIFSDVIFFLLFQVFGYRKKVVLDNLKKSFPKKSDSELKKITKGFYKNLSDVMIESLKGLSMSKKTLLQRYKVLNPEMTNKYYEQNKSVIAIASHYCNWEWGVLCLSLQFKHKSVGLYKPISNKYIDNYIRKTRANWGMNLVSIQETSRFFEKNKSEVSIYYMIADQSPSNIKDAYWVDFLNQDTACLHGPENYSKKYNLPVVYGHVERVKRGYYEISISNVETNPKEKAHGEITQAYMKILENYILKKPENWLWSHKRWKKNRSDINKN